MARTLDEMIASGDIQIIHPGVNWGITLNKTLSDEDFEVLWKYVTDNSKDHDK